MQIGQQVTDVSQGVFISQRLLSASQTAADSPSVNAIIGQLVDNDAQLYFSLVFRKRVRVSPNEYSKCATPADISDMRFK
ncbi:hypothetical protein CF105_02350 [Aeromonas veronii]|nr:hypothetical protein CF105_02350 [Aeromonas veronii]